MLMYVNVHLPQSDQFKSKRKIIEQKMEFSFPFQHKTCEEPE